MEIETYKHERNNPEYLAHLLKDKKQIQAFPNVFVHLETLLDEEINRVRIGLFHNKSNTRDLFSLPEREGPVVTLSEKLYVPVKDHPEFNFVGRILGPRGRTAKELEQYTGAKIMVRGKGSMRDKAKEDQHKGKPNWEHLNEELHVLVMVEDTKNRAELKLIKAVQEVKKLLVPAKDWELKEISSSSLDGQVRDNTWVPQLFVLGTDGYLFSQESYCFFSAQPEGEDKLKMMQLRELGILNRNYRSNKFLFPMKMASAREDNLKKHQLMELAIINGTYRDSSKPTSMQPTPPSATQTTRSMTSPFAGMTAIQQLHMPTLAGTPLIYAPRLPFCLPTSQPNAATGFMNGGPPPLVPPSEAGTQGLMYSPYEYPFSMAPSTAILDCPSLEQSTAGSIPKIRQTITGVREHPYRLPPNMSWAQTNTPTAVPTYSNAFHMIGPQLVDMNRSLFFNQNQ